MTVKKKYVIVVAAYSPIGSFEDLSPAASKKIELVIRMLSRLGERLILINSAHNSTQINRTTVKTDSIAGKRVIVITPFTLQNRKLGKALNTFIATKLARRLAKRASRLLWLWNGSIFESLFSMAFLKSQNIPLIIELEDWPTARDRGLNNIKCWLDHFYLKKVLPMATLITYVNQELLDKLNWLKTQKLLFPSFIHPKIAIIRDQHKPFSGQSYAVGYFGYLAKEKGVDIFLQLVDDLPDNWQILMTGSGPLIELCRQIANKYTNRLTFIPSASNEQLYSLMAKCDVIVNPHASIKNMGNGVFPFKVFEALASKRLVISTPLPRCGIDLEEAIMWFDGSIEGLLEHLARAETFYHQQQEKIEATSEQIINEYSEHAMFNKFKKILLESEHTFNKQNTA